MGVTAQKFRGIVNAAADVYTQAGATANGTAYVQIVASTSVPILVVAIHSFGSTPRPPSPADVILATGAAASEVAVATVNTGGGAGASGSNTAGGGALFSLPFPIRVGAGIRLAMKLSAADTVSVFGIVYINESAVT